VVVVSVGIVVKDDGSNEAKLSGCVSEVDLDRKGDEDEAEAIVEGFDSRLGDISDEGSIMDEDCSDVPDEAKGEADADAEADVPDIFVYISASDESELGV
jgi:hypothetical protein